MKNNLKSHISKIYVNLLSFCTLLLLAGCISSEETGAGAKAKSPVKTYGSVDSAQYLMKKDTLDSKVVTQQKVAPRFKSRQDTLQASIIKKSNLSLSLNTENELTEHSVYTVQIGAYTDATNALQRQKRAKQQFAGQPIFNKYEESTKLYRISIGRYEDSKDALALSDSLKQQYPDEYGQCWINFIP